MIKSKAREPAIVHTIHPLLADSVTDVITQLGVITRGDVLKCDKNLKKEPSYRTPVIFC